MERLIVNDKKENNFKKTKLVFIKKSNGQIVLKVKGIVKF
jgi:hypothetical protein